MRIVGLRVSNWMRFRGEHELELGPTVYAVVAEHASDPDRSNWMGKTSVFSAIRFALTGAVPTETQDDAINRGQPAMSVDMELDDGSFITRSRRRGKTTELVANLVRGGKEVVVRDQAELERQLGFNEATFLATSYFEQREMARFVRARPADRSAIVSEWLDTAPIQAAHRRVADKLAAVEKALAALTGERKAHEDRLQQDVEALRRNAAAVTAKRDKWVETRKAAEQAAARAKLLRELHDLDEQLKAMPSVDIDAVTKALGSAKGEAKKCWVALQSTKQAHKEAQENARGGFDGVCPVTCEECPVADAVQKNSDALEDRAELLGIDLRRHGKESSAADAEVVRLEKLVTAHAQWILVQDRRNHLAATLGPAVDVKESIETCDSEIAHLEKTYRDLDGAVRDDERARVVLAELSDRVGKLEQQRLALDLAARVLGRGGVQRRLAEGFVGYLQERATARLQDAGIDLAVRLVWGRETQQLAEACDECGQPYPRSAKVVQCQCGARRGMKRDDKLHVELSDRSGAAEDLAGVALQLAAAEWIREARGVAWGTVLLDEPFGQLDAANRASLARVLSRLASDGFEQALVIAHDRGILDSMPGRILVRGDDSASSVGVV